MTLRSLAVRVKSMDRMVAFYSEAFGVEFREVITRGVPAMFGQMDGITLKFVDLGDGESDSEMVQSHQIGIAVPDVDGVIALAIEHGGEMMGEPLRNGDRVHAAIRDPDGNSLELYTL